MKYDRKGVKAGIVHFGVVIIGGKHTKGDPDIDLHAVLWEFFEANLK